MAFNAPGLPPAELARMTPEQTGHVRKAIEGELKAQREERLAYLKVLVRASGARLH